ncbi:hypothetical protein BVC80_1081g10 [Macleaya cordata]|uniref:Uncharacterized protein n=1 Tax=Macleaya cordata TaxID=56857 RepID=A0A200PWC6_MACCD|nr:hypothetical protein BVC80_1081g10 [Macleaya cordata]
MMGCSFRSPDPDRLQEGQMHCEVTVIAAHTDDLSREKRQGISLLDILYSHVLMVHQVLHSLARCAGMTWEKLTAIYSFFLGSMVYDDIYLLMYWVGGKARTRGGLSQSNDGVEQRARMRTRGGLSHSVRDGASTYGQGQGSSNPAAASNSSRGRRGRTSSGGRGRGRSSSMPVNVIQSLTQSLNDGMVHQMIH